MSDAIGSLRIDLGLEMVQFMTKMREAQNETVTATTRMADAAGHAQRAIQGMVAGFIGFEGLKGIADATIKFQSYQYTLDAATKSQADAAREMQFVLDTAQKFGLNLDSAAQAYARMAFEAGQAGMSTQQLRDMFTAVSGSMRVLHLDQTHTKASFLALQEIMGSTTVQTRHLTKQLSIDFPGALQAAARGMNMTTGQLLELARSGKLMSTDFIAGLTKGLNEAFGPQFEESSHGAQAAFERMHTAWMALQNAIGNSGLIDIMASFANGVSQVAQAFGAFQVKSEQATRSSADFGVVARYIGVFVAGMTEGFQELGHEIGAWGAIMSTVFDDIKSGNFSAIGRDYHTISLAFQQDLKDIHAEHDATVKALLNPLPAADPNKDPLGALKAPGMHMAEPAKVDKSAVRALQQHQQALLQFQQQMDAIINKLSTTGNPVLDHYRDTIQQIAKDAEEASRRGLSFAETNDRIALAVSAAQAQMAKEQAAFRKQFDQQTTDLVAQTKGQLAQAANEYMKEVATAAQILQSGQINTDEYAARVMALHDQYNKVIADSKTAQDTMSEYAKQAARNIQNTFANFLFDPFKNGLKGMLQSFGNTLRQMAAQALAAKLFDALGSWGKGNSGASGIMGLLGTAASYFGGAKASGGNVSGDRTYLVGENGPELFSPGMGGHITPNHALAGAGGPTINQYFTVQAPQGRISRETDLNLRTTAGMAVRQAMARNG